MRLHFQDTQFPDVSGQDDVVFEPERDEYRCPQGPPRRRSAIKGTEGVVASCGEVAVCHACPVKAQYTTSQWLNTVPRSPLARWRDYGEEWAFVAPDLIVMSPSAPHRVYGDA
jgi:hypothetical protein